LPVPGKTTDKQVATSAFGLLALTIIIAARPIPEYLL
jgi:hypothetical protein